MNDKVTNSDSLDDEIARFVTQADARKDPFPFINRLRETAPIRQGDPVPAAADL